MARREILLLVLLPIQIAICVLSQKEIPTGSLILLFFLLAVDSLFFWAKIASTIKDRERSERWAELHIRMFIFFKLSPKGIKQTAKSNVTTTMIFMGIFLSIALLVFIVLFLIYAISNSIWIMNHFIKPSRIAGLVILIAGCAALIINAVKNKRMRQHSFSKENITLTGLVIENILFSMIAFSY